MAWTVELLVPSREAVLTRIGAAGAALRPYFNIYTAEDLLLATLDLGDPVGSVDPVTAVLTLNPGDPESSAPNSGVAAKAILYDRDGVALSEELAVEESLVAVPNKVALSSLNIPAGGIVSLISVSIG